MAQFIQLVLSQPRQYTGAEKARAEAQREIESAYNRLRVMFIAPLIHSTQDVNNDAEDSDINKHMGELRGEP